MQKLKAALTWERMGKIIWESQCLSLKKKPIASRAGPKINADDVAPSYGLFLTCREEKCIQYYRWYFKRTPLEYPKIWRQKSLTWGIGHHCIMQTSLQLGPMLDINCLFPTSHLPHPFPKSTPFLAPVHRCNTIFSFNFEHDIGMPEAFSVCHTID